MTRNIDLWTRGQFELLPRIRLAWNQDASGMWYINIGFGWLKSWVAVGFRRNGKVPLLAGLKRFK